MHFIENERKYARQIELQTLFVSHIFIQNDKATSVDFYKKKAREREEKRSRGKRGRRNSYIVVVVVAVVSPSFLISRVNFHCMQQKNEEEEKLQQRR